MTDHAFGLARNLRERRERAGMSLGELAEAAGVAKSTMHALEQGEGNPTLNTLWALARALGVTLGDLVEERHDRVTVVRAGAGTHIDSDGIRARLLHRADTSVIEIYELTIDDRESAPHRPGVDEYLYVTSGAVDVGPVDAPTALGPQDFIAFDGSTTHAYRATERPARALLVMSYPTT